MQLESLYIDLILESQKYYRQLDNAQTKAYQVAKRIENRHILLKFDTSELDKAYSKVKDLKKTIESINNKISISSIGNRVQTVKVDNSQVVSAIRDLNSSTRSQTDAIVEAIESLENTTVETNRTIAAVAPAAAAPLPGQTQATQAFRGAGGAVAAPLAQLGGLAGKFVAGKAIGQAITSAIEGLKLKQKGKGLSDDLKSGLELGLQNSKNVAGKAVDMSQAILSSIRSTLGIRSPSWITRMYGKFLGSGLGQGVVESFDVTRSIVKRESQTLIRAVRDELNKNQTLEQTAKDLGKRTRKGFIDELKGQSTLKFPFKEDLQRFRVDVKKEYEALRKLRKQKDPSLVDQPKKPNQGIDLGYSDIRKTVRASAGIPNYVMKAISNDREVFKQRKISKIQSQKVQEALAKSTVEYLQQLDNVQNEVIVTIDGLSADSKKAQKNLENWAKATFDGVQVFSQELKESDLTGSGLSSPVKKAQKTIENFNKFYIQGDVNPDALKLASQILAIATKNPNANISALGRGVGGNVLQESMFMLQQSGYGDRIKNVKGLGLGTVTSAESFKAENFEAAVPKSSFIRAAGVTEKGTIEIYKAIKENFIKAVLINPAILATSLAIPQVGAARAALAIPKLVRARSKVISRGLGDEEFNEKIAQNLGRESTFITYPRRVEEFMRSEKELASQRIQIQREASQKIKDTSQDNAKVQKEGIASVLSFAKGVLMRTVTLYGAFSLARTAFSFIVTFPTQLQNLGAAFAATQEPIKNQINILARSRTAYEEMSSVAQSFGADIALATESYRDFLLLERSRTIGQGQAENINTDLLEIVTNYGVINQDRANFFKEFKQLFANVDRLELDKFYSLERALPSTISNLNDIAGTNNLQELVEGVNAGQIDKNRVLLDLIERLRIESAELASATRDTEIGSDNRLLAQTQVFQQQVGDMGSLDALYKFLVDIQILGLKALPPLLESLDELFTLIGSMAAIGSVIALAKGIQLLVRPLTDPKLMGVNLFDKFYDSLTQLSPKLGRTVPLVGRFLSITKQVGGVLAPIALLAGAWSTVTETLEDFNRVSEATEARLDKLKEAYTVINPNAIAPPEPSFFDKAKNFVQPRVDELSPYQYLPTTLDQGLDRTLDLRQSLGRLFQSVNPFSDRNAVKETAKLLKPQQIATSVTGKRFDIGQDMTLGELSEVQSFQEGLKESMEIMRSIQNESLIGKLTQDDIDNVKRDLIEIEAQINTKDINITQALVSGDFENLRKLKEELRSLKDERDDIIDRLGTINPLKVAIEDFKKEQSDIIQTLSRAGFTEETFKKANLNRQDPENIDALRKLEKDIFRQGFKSIDEFVTRMQEVGIAIREGEEQLETYGDTLRSVADNLKRISFVFNELQVDRLNRDFNQNLGNNQNQIGLNLAMANGSVGSLAFDAAQSQMNQQALQKTRQSAMTQLSGIEGSLGEFNSANIATVKEALGITGDLIEELKNNTNLSPQGIAQVLESFKNEDGKIDPALQEMANQISKYLQLTEEISNIDVQISQNIQQQAQQDRQRVQSIQQLKQNIQDFNLNRTRTIQDFNRQIEDSAIAINKENKSLVNEYNDFLNELQNNSRTIANDISRINQETRNTELTNNLAESLIEDLDSPFENLSNILNDALNISTEADQQVLTLEEQRIQSERQNLETTRRIEEMGYRRFDVERQRIQTLIQFNRQEVDFKNQQSRAWFEITQRIRDMFGRSMDMSLSFDSIADTLSLADQKLREAVASISTNYGMANPNTSGSLSGKDVTGFADSAIDFHIGGKLEGLMPFSKEEWNLYRNSLASIESNGKYNIFGGSGNHYDGRYQLGAAAKIEAAKVLRSRGFYANDGHDPASRKRFRENPIQQENFLYGFTADNYRQLSKLPQFKNADNQRKLEILAYAHNQGASGAEKWLRTGSVSKDGFGTKGTKFSETIRKNFEKALKLSIPKTQDFKNSILAGYVGDSGIGTGPHLDIRGRKGGQKGRRLTEAELKAYLPYVQIGNKNITDYQMTSGYNLRRVHPVTGQIKPHPAFDYSSADIEGKSVQYTGGGEFLGTKYQKDGAGYYSEIRTATGDILQFLHLQSKSKNIGQQQQQQFAPQTYTDSQQLKNFGVDTSLPQYDDSALKQLQAEQAILEEKQRQQQEEYNTQKLRQDNLNLSRQLVQETEQIKKIYEDIGSDFDRIQEAQIDYKKQVRETQSLESQRSNFALEREREFKRVIEPIEDLRDRLEKLREQSDKPLTDSFIKDIITELEEGGNLTEENIQKIKELQDLIKTGGDPYDYLIGDQGLLNNLIAENEKIRETLINQDVDDENFQYRREVEDVQGQIDQEKLFNPFATDSQKRLAEIDLQEKQALRDVGRRIEDAIRSGMPTETVEELKQKLLELNEIKFENLRIEATDTFKALEGLKSGLESSTSGFIAGFGEAIFSREETDNSAEEARIQLEYAEKLAELSERYQGDPGRFNEARDNLEMLNNIKLDGLESEVSAIDNIFDLALNALADFAKSFAQTMADLAAKQLISGLFGGLFGGGSGFGGIFGFANGGKVGTFASGGKVGSPSFSGDISTALTREGAGAELIVAHKNERVLTDRNGDAQFMDYLMASGTWQKLKSQSRFSTFNYGSYSNQSSNSRSMNYGSTSTEFRPSVSNVFNTVINNQYNDQNKLNQTEGQIRADIEQKNQRAASKYN